MAGFGQTANAQKELKKEKATAQPPLAVTTMTGGDMFADMRAEEAKMGEDKMTHMFVGLAGFDGTGKSGVVKHAFDIAYGKTRLLGARP